MHACIAALSQHIPAVAIAYSDKFIGVLDTIGVPSLVADVRKLETQQVLCVISEALSSRQLLRAQLVRRIPAIKATVLNLCSELPEFQAEWESSPELILSGR
jgi:polysaccharide pyruvyl transferase WcaK-like protein